MTERTGTGAGAAAVAAVSQRKSVLLDTCVLARLSLYCQACLAAKLELGCTIDRLHRSMHDLQLCSRPGDLLDSQYIREGQRTWSSIAAASDLHYSYSLLSQLETQVLLEDKAIDAKLFGKVPFRLWRNKPLRMQTEIDYDTEVLGNWTYLVEALESVADVDCIERANEVKPSEIADVSNILSRHLILDPIDLYLYSCAVFAMVDEVWTHDEDFRIVVGNLRSNGRYRNQRQAILGDLSMFNAKFAAGDFKLPCVIQPSRGAASTR